MKSYFLNAAWNNLIMANYAVPSDILLPFLHYGTVLDSFQGKTYVSLVGFMFMNTKMMGLTVPYHVNFEEVNLRFYVKNNASGTWRSGVSFIKEIVPKPAITLIANSLYKEKYATMKMRHFQHDKGGVVETGYEWKFKNKWNKISAVSEKKSLPSVTIKPISLIQAISSRGKYTSLIIPWLMVNETLDALFSDLPIPSLELDVHFASTPGAPGAFLFGIKF